MVRAAEPLLDAMDKALTNPDQLKPDLTPAQVAALNKLDLIVGPFLESHRRNRAPRGRLHVVSNKGGDVIKFPKRPMTTRRDDDPNDPNDPKRFVADPLWGQVGDILSEGVFVYAGGSAATVMIAEPVPEAVSELAANDNIEESDSLVSESDTMAEEQTDSPSNEALLPLLPVPVISGLPMPGVPVGVL